MASKYVLLLSVLLQSMVFAQLDGSKRFDPTGAYVLTGKVDEKNVEIYGFSGVIKVKALEDSRIVITLFLSTGAPGYDIETVWDTLKVVRNTATWFPGDDSSYNITFIFKRTNIVVHRIQRNPGRKPAGGRHVIVVGSFIKTSNEVPLIDDPLKG